MTDKIQQDEVILRERGQWIHFHHPHKIIVCETLDEVIPSLLEVERLVDERGWYAAGFLSYESATAFDSALPSKPSEGFPYLWFGLYPKPDSVDPSQRPSVRKPLNWKSAIDRDEYNAAIAKIKAYIAQGKTYQVNYTMRLQADYSGSAWAFFLQLAEGQNKHAAYIDTGRYVICSASPELFFQLAGNTITCRPMKGTARRGRTTAEDQRQSDGLKSSEKNRAENVMIVDMVRNDLGRIAQVGSVQVPALFCPERYRTLWQMTSTITAHTRASVTNIFRALFPSASITGAPKVSTMHIIEQLETTPRKIYTGSIGYIAPNRKASFNVAIRTLLLDRVTRAAEYGVGGGIVWDSSSENEYQEALLKAQVLNEPQPEFCLLETMRWTPEEGFYLGEKHLARLIDSARYFDFPLSKAEVETKLEEIAATYPSPQRLRLLADQAGAIQVDSVSLQASQTTLRVRLAKSPVDSNNVFLFHKTTQRAVYENARSAFPDCDDVLLYNERGELTEFTIGNLVVELHGQLMSPPIECGLLAGTFRAHLLETSLVHESMISIPQLKDCTKIFRVNSVRGWEEVKLLG